MKTFVAEFTNATGKMYMSFSASDKAEAVDHANFCKIDKTDSVKVKMVKTSEIDPDMMGRFIEDISYLFKEGVWAF